LCCMRPLEEALQYDGSELQLIHGYQLLGKLGRCHCRLPPVRSQWGLAEPETQHQTTSLDVLFGGLLPR